MYCVHCGTEIPDGAKFCRNCGNAQESHRLQFSSDFSGPICALISILSLLIFFFPWIKIDERVSWYAGDSLNFFGTIRLLREWAEDESIVSIAVWILIIAAVILLLIHLSGIYAAIKRNENFALYCSDSGAWSIVFSIIFVVTIFFLDAQEGALHYGWGVFTFLLLGAVQLAICRYIHMNLNISVSNSSED